MLFPNKSSAHPESSEPGSGCRTMVNDGQIPVVESRDLERLKSFLLHEGRNREGKHMHRVVSWYGPALIPCQHSPETQALSRCPPLYWEHPMYLKDIPPPLQLPHVASSGVPAHAAALPLLPLNPLLQIPRAMWNHTAIPASAEGTVGGTRHINMNHTSATRHSRTCTVAVWAHGEAQALPAPPGSSPNTYHINPSSYTLGVPALGVCCSSVRQKLLQLLLI